MSYNVYTQYFQIEGNSKPTRRVFLTKGNDTLSEYFENQLQLYFNEEEKTASITYMGKEVYMYKINYVSNIPEENFKVINLEVMKSEEDVYKLFPNYNNSTTIVSYKANEFADFKEFVNKNFERIIDGIAENMLAVYCN